jgi:HSP20 family molecular chaperone IbpA
MSIRREPAALDSIAATPPANVYEGNGELSIATPIPGSHPQHTEVLVTPAEVRIEARCKYPQESQHYHRREWQVGSWRLTIGLPKRVDPQRARATLNLGVLVVMAPLSESGSGEGRPGIQ